MGAKGGKRSHKGRERKLGALDLVAVLQNFGKPTPNWTDGNFDLTDLASVLNNFGQSSPNPAASSPSTMDSALSASLATPEPTSLSLLTLSISNQYSPTLRATFQTCA
jgi:hypothetical protein